MKRRAFLKNTAIAAAACVIPVTVYAGIGEAAPVIQKTQLTGLQAIVAETLRNRSAEIARNITGNNALLAYLNR